MITQPYVLLMARYNRWMNRKVYDAASTLTDAQRREDRKAFFGSAHGTLNHLLYGDLAWLGRFVNGEPRAFIADKELHGDFADLRSAREALDDETVRWAGQVTDGWLAAPFTYISNIDKQPRTKPAWILVTHMFNHATHHRGQLATLLTQFGLDIGVTDLPAMPGDA
jgi:uncharacterized damage-inducible protein DinB